MSEYVGLVPVGRASARQSQPDNLNPTISTRQSQLIEIHIFVSEPYIFFKSSPILLELPLIGFIYGQIIYSSACLCRQYSIKP
ncbi:MAG: hypothetical protein ACI93R_002338 [Flavobacteriales bacterium]|jgi:hypothetical protein